MKKINLKYKIYRAHKKSVSDIDHLYKCLLKYESRFRCGSIKITNDNLRKQDIQACITVKKETNCYLLAGNKNEIFGYIYGEVIRYQNEIIGNITSLYVIDKFRGLDMGRKLVYRLIEWFKEKGVNRIQLSILSNNPSINFWEKMGFKKFSTKLEKILK